MFAKNAIVWFMIFPGLLTVRSTANAVENNKTLKADVQVVLDKLPLDKQEEFKDFAKLVERYISEYDWIEEEDVPPVEIGVQIFLEKQPTSIEERYNCTILVTGDDIRYYDKRVVFPFQKGEKIEHGGQFHPLSGIIDFYLYLAIASEVANPAYL